MSDCSVKEVIENILSSHHIVPSKGLSQTSSPHTHPPEPTVEPLDVTSSLHTCISAHTHTHSHTHTFPLMYPISVIIRIFSPTPFFLFSLPPPFCNHVFMYSYVHLIFLLFSGSFLVSIIYLFIHAYMYLFYLLIMGARGKRAALWSHP